MNDILEHKTRESKEGWLRLFFKYFPPQSPYIFSDKNNTQIDDDYYQYQSHCHIHNIKISNGQVD